MRRPLLYTIVLVLVARPVFAQQAVFDPAVTAQNVISAVLKEYLISVQRNQHTQLWKMGRRLSVFTDLGKYAPTDPPRWRTHGGDFLFAQVYNDALIFGDPPGAAFLAVSHPVLSAQGLLGRLGQASRRAITSRLATLNLTDAAAIAATNDTGQIRLNGRKKELPAIDALEAHSQPGRWRRYRFSFISAKGECSRRCPRLDASSPRIEPTRYLFRKFVAEREGFELFEPVFLTG